MEERITEEVVDIFKHTMGKLILSSNPDNEFYCNISFVPNQIIDPIQIEAIRWFFLKMAMVSLLGGKHP